MEQGSDTITVDEAQEIRDTIVGRQVCPFCGAVTEQQEGPCPRCTMENNPASRQATKSRIGPWYVLQTRNPAAPGMRFDTLLGFVRKGRVKAKSIVRGPTTHQLWRFAAHVKGLSREFGVCYSCGGGIEKAADLCPHCNRSQDPPANPDVFLEGQDQPALAGKIPVYRELEAPLLGDETVVPPVRPLREPEPSGSAQPTAEPRSTRKNTDGFLTAQDLAAAFKLDFQPKSRHGRQQTAPPAQRPRAKVRKPRRWGRKILLLMVLGGASAAGYQLYRDPVLRDRVIAQATQWYQEASSWIGQKWKELHQPPPAKTPHEFAPAVLAVQAPPRPQETEARPVPQQTQPATKPNAWDQLLYEPRSSTVHYRQGTRDDVWALYTSAIDAEAQGDYSNAIKKYSQIKEFAPDLWPRDLELRLKEARRQIQ